MRFAVLWDNGHASGLLSGRFDNEEDADLFGRDWQTEMEAATPGCEEGDYIYEVVEVDENDKVISD